MEPIGIRLKLIIVANIDPYFIPTIVILAQMSDAKKKLFTALYMSTDKRIPRMSGQCGASHTSVTLYRRRTAKYGTDEKRHTQSRLND